MPPITLLPCSSSSFSLMDFHTKYPDYPIPSLSEAEWFMLSGNEHVVQCGGLVDKYYPSECDHVLSFPFLFILGDLSADLYCLDACPVSATSTIHVFWHAGSLIIPGDHLSVSILHFLWFYLYLSYSLCRIRQVFWL